LIVVEHVHVIGSMVARQSAPAQERVLSLNLLLVVNDNCDPFVPHIIVISESSMI
jgi:hypothetical protein